MNERLKECESVRVTFEHRHENKSCSACRDRVNERVKVLKVVKVAKVVKVKVFQVYQNIPGSQLLSDIQTFFSETLCISSYLDVVAYEVSVVHGRFA